MNPKAEERMQRYLQNFQVYEIAANHSLPDWTKILSSDVNKNALIMFLCSYIEDNLEISVSQGNKKLFLAGGYSDRRVTKMISSSGEQDYKNLFSNHTEADSRIIVHAYYVIKQYTDATLIVKSPDTDVFTLLIAHYSQLTTDAELWFKTGHVTRKTDLRRYIPIYK